ncbi:MAG: PAS domain-containing protein, partial [Deltaproteobacteria bacterium]|nr:PAS domain-containing protein [Deltaproteobacteria bacterium]
MTTKNKIIVGFGCMIAIIAVISVMGYLTLDSSMAGYEEYRRYARLNVQYSDVLTSFNAAGIAANAYLDGYNDAHIKKAQADMDEVEKHLSAAMKEMTDKRRLAVADDLRNKVRGYRESLGKLHVACRRMQELFREKVAPNRITSEDAIHLMVRQAQRSNNTTLLTLFTQLGDQLADLRFAMGTFTQSRSAEHGNTVVAKAAEARTTIAQMRASSRQPYTLSETHGKLTAVFSAWADGLAATIEAGAAVNAIVAELRTIRASLNTNFEELNAAYDKEMSTHGPAIKESMLGGQRLLMGGSGAGLVIGVLAALMIISGLVKVLGETGAFARALADGDFKAEVKIHEKGEIGALLDSMRQIPAVLQTILGEYQKLERQVEAGDLEARGDPAACKGGFAAMIAGTNAVLGRFLHVVESIPSPVVSLNSAFKVVYLNATGRSVCGADYKGKTCKQVMARDDSDTPGDALRKAVESLKPVSGETHARPQGKEMDISYTAIPMLD